MNTGYTVNTESSLKAVRMYIHYFLLQWFGKPLQFTWLLHMVDSAIIQKSEIVSCLA